MFNNLLKKKTVTGNGDSFKLNQPVQPKIVESYQKEILIRIENRELTAAPDAIWLLLSNNSTLKQRVAEGLLNLVGSMTGVQLFKLDSLFRERTSIGWALDWSTESPGRLVEPEMSDAEKTVIYGLASFHPNGFYREKALRALTAFETGLELPFFLIRMNDWVNQIRSLAVRELNKRLNGLNAKGMVRCLPLIFHLRQCKRTNHEPMTEQFIAFLVSPEGSPALIDGLRNRDYKVRNLCFKLIAGQDCIDRQALLEYLKLEPLPVNRLMGLRRIEPFITLPEYLENKSWLFTDKSASIRILALEIGYKFLIEESCLEELENGLLDPSAGVRETSRFLLKKAGYELDFRQRYLEVLLASKISIGAISGLGEVGNAADAKVIEPFLDNGNVNIIKIAMSAIAKLNLLDYKGRMIWRLADWRPGISKVARMLLSRELNLQDAAVVYRIYGDSKISHVRKNCVRLLALLGKWDSLGYILESHASDDEEIRRIGKATLERWILRYNRSFVNPTDNQLTIIKEALKKYGASLQETEREFLEFNLRAF